MAKHGLFQVALICATQFAILFAFWCVVLFFYSFSSGGPRSHTGDRSASERAGLNPRRCVAAVAASLREAIRQSLSFRSLLVAASAHPWDSKLTLSTALHSQPPYSNATNFQGIHPRLGRRCFSLNSNVQFIIRTAKQTKLYAYVARGRVEVAGKDLTNAVIQRIDSPYALHLPLHIEPSFNLTISSLPAAIQTRARTRTAASSAADGSPPPTVLSVPMDAVDHYLVSPEYLANVDRPQVEIILKTVEHVATRNSLRDQCDNSGRDLIRLLVRQADSGPASIGMAIGSMMQAHFDNGSS
eukprot:6188129-Pleurochrysis_carterae.AAC.2